MAPHQAGSAENDGPSENDSAPPLRRRFSMEEDFLYSQIVTGPRRPSQPPPYQKDAHRKDPEPSGLHVGTAVAKGKEAALGGGQTFTTLDSNEALPDYSNPLMLEGVFSKKHEIENATKRAEDRQWHTVFVTLNGTALQIHQTKKKSWGWSRSRDDGPSVDSDNPPWIKKSKLERTYSLLYADVGIAADYKKRRYVIRIRAETDQFLLSCVELSTFVKWLQALFAAIDVATPIDERDFPRDMSIPRIQRIRWYRGETPTATQIDVADLNLPEMSTEEPAPEGERRTSVSSETALEQLESDTGETSVIPPPRVNAVHRLSTSSYPNLAIDPSSGKWFPEHRWSSAHDLLYAKLCYSNLLFRSPRKSNYVVDQGKEWYVDWMTGRKVRVLPPTYGEIDWFGPWSTVHTENRRI